MQFDPHHLSALAAVLRLGSFDAAAAALSVTPSAISQRIKALEDRLGSVLIQRGSPCTGTPAGLRLAKHAEDVGLLEAQLSRELKLETGPDPARLRIAVNADSLATWFVEAMAQVQDVLFELVIDDQDHSSDWLRRGEVSAAICAHDKPISGCEAHPLGALRYFATASPDFVKTWFAEGVGPDTLSLAPCLVYNAKDRLQHRWMEQVSGERISPPAHFLPSSHAFVDAARAGIGWGMNPQALVRGPIRNGRLVALVPDAPLDVPLTWQISRVLGTALSPVTRAVKKAALKSLVQDSSRSHRD